VRSLPLALVGVQSHDHDVDRLTSFNCDTTDLTVFLESEVGRVLTWRLDSESLRDHQVVPL